MTEEFVVSLAKSAMFTALVVSGPILILGLVVGLAVGIFQAVTQIHEMTLTFVPKILVAALAVFLFAPWMLRMLISFTLQVFGYIPSVAH
ncbi:MAG: flagellar biosynthesis protein FliQ [candidate division KSB1 bacterium]|nr:flagellar biosynthesis protein FliQ [candidate division KSB1 bacterium]